ncbi:MAG TPA: hypothetical protein PLK04_00890 [Bacillota bacterium]|nr:hypothetical protein [Bacillota bacterium]HOO29626.1 hypothetical protein [Bacillota bacterium]HPZ12775.1 hypothetical protein [Bacillota bacterium]HQD79833.1 hypothetical protein [Bacillota bacterium]
MVQKGGTEDSKVLEDLPHRQPYWGGCWDFDGAELISVWQGDIARGSCE